MEGRQVVLSQHFLRGEDMAVETKTIATVEKHLRVISPTKAERLLGFSANWTYLEETETTIREGRNRRKNGVGNAFAVPVIARLFLALCLCFDPVTASPTALLECQSLPAPLHPDILDDLIALAYMLASEFRDLTEEFDILWDQSGQIN